jgi:phosphatidylglycerophosphate synthase
MAADRKSAAQAERTSRALLATAERWALTRIAARLPGWVLPDHLTVLALVAAVLITAAYALSNRDPAWLWLASAGLVVHWFGDSLDGTLARVRKIQRPRYGFYVDHLADAFSTVCIGLGLGFSPYMLLSVGLAVVVAYLVLSINVYLETITQSQFRFGYGIIGPTEARLALIGLNTLAVLVGPLPFEVLGVGATVFDLLGVLGAISMLAMLLRRAVRNLRSLGAEEPPGVLRPDD